MPTRSLERKTGLVLAALALCAAGVAGDRDDPITTLQDALGDRLRSWWKEGTAAGNVGDFYDNRDREHSLLDLSQFPQLSRWRYSDTEKARKADWAAQVVLWQGVTLGNSSTSAPAAIGGSNPRRLYSVPEGLRRLELQYRRNNLYVYPEHQDHDPGHNGVDGGYGDLYPTNTPYLVVSQGSSGSDQAFLRALAASLAAFRPEVKARLVEANMLMPALQMILRSSYGAVDGPADYLKGKAHPSAFDGSLVDALKMAERAHQMRLGTTPALVQLAVVSEDPPVTAQASEDGPSELLSDTPSCIARVVRRREYTRRLVVTAELSRDLDQRPLTYHWSVLRGDPEHVRIRPLTAGFSTVEIQVDYHARSSIDGHSPLQSNRVDIGAFANNGTGYSAPAFVTFFSLDSEARTYEGGGRLVEIGYGAGVADVDVTDWPAFLDQIAAAAPSPGAAFFKERIGGGRLARILAAGAPLREAEAKLRQAEAEEREASAAAQAAESRRKTAQAAKAAAEETVGKAPTQEARAALERAAAELAVADPAVTAAASRKSAAATALGSAREAFEKVLAPARAIAHEAFAEVIADAQLWASQHEALLALLQGSEEIHRVALLALREQLVALGFVPNAPREELSLAPRLLRAGSPGPAGAPTRFERILLDRLNAATLANLLLPGAVTDSYTPNYVDPALASAQNGRDVFHYAADGTLSGFTHFGEAGVQEFDAQGKPLAGK